MWVPDVAHCNAVSRRLFEPINRVQYYLTRMVDITDAEEKTKAKWRDSEEVCEKADEMLLSIVCLFYEFLRTYEGKTVSKEQRLPLTCCLVNILFLNEEYDCGIRELHREFHLDSMSYSNQRRISCFLFEQWVLAMCWNHSSLFLDYVSNKNGVTSHMRSSLFVPRPLPPVPRRTQQRTKRRRTADFYS